MLVGFVVVLFGVLCFVKLLLFFRLAVFWVCLAVVFVGLKLFVGLLWCFSAWSVLSVCCGVFRLAVFVRFTVVFFGLL